MAVRNEYPLRLMINHRQIKRVIIDQHYKERHPDVTDETILELIQSIDGNDFLIESERGDFQYFTAEPVFKDDSPYRLVMMLCIFDDYLGVINAFRVDRSKHE
ncbi:MAG: hypothetical protein H6624_20230 [Bdellovibrionaceae bacterium]|nr:hypothetical protein [Bdellovibrionales bacterium]MCB9086681.1 hypothetical protein [Pseudobdellovibrionaceae bacterium]